MNKAKQIAKQLIKIYTKYKIPEYSNLNSQFPEGFTAKRIKQNPQDSLFQLIILASYDRQPFTIVAGGWEPIWGVSKNQILLPSLLRKAGLFSLTGISQLKESDINTRLAKCNFYGCPLNTDGRNTKYKLTFKQTAHLIQTDNMVSDIQAARTSNQAYDIFSAFDGIHGIGPTIAEV